MSQSDASFEPIRQALASLFAEEKSQRVRFDRKSWSLLLRLPTDVAAFSVLTGHPQEEFEEAYGEFRRLYRENHSEWDALTISFVICRTSIAPENDRFYASLEHDPLFCRKYVINSCRDVSEQRRELLRLPFLPLPKSTENGSHRVQSAQDILQAAGISASLARKFVEAQHRSPERIVADLRSGEEILPKTLTKPDPGRIVLAKPRAFSHLTTATIEGFRAYRKSQEFTLNAPVIVLYGPNGLGKTSFFDAIDYACTGRIARLCRHQTRKESEFAKIATHLDKTPGSGSVELRGITRGNGNQDAEWSLKRGTGNWSNAWLNGEEVDRRAVLAFLTNANWVESKPRQQAFESLFRATHLFGQDEQELMVQFRKNSVMPEEFISEMLALQDYSQGLAKAKAVLKILQDERKDTETVRQDLRRQEAELSSDIVAETTTLAAEPSSPIEEAFSSFVATSALLTSAEGDLPATPTRSALEEWNDMASARIDTLKQHVNTANRLRPDVSEWPTVEAETIQLESALLAAEQARLSTVNQVSEAGQLLAIAGEALQIASSDWQKLDSRRSDMRVFLVELLASRHELSAQRDVAAEAKAQCTAERTDATDRVEALRRELERLTILEKEKSNAVENTRAKSAQILKLIETFDNYATDLNRLAELRDQIQMIGVTLQRNAELRTLAQSHALTARQERERSAIDFDRASARRSEQQRLLDAIAADVHTAECPVCGTVFESISRLLDRINERRAVVEDADVFRRHEELVRVEALADDALRKATDSVAANERQRDALVAESDAVTKRLGLYLSRASAALGMPISEDILLKLQTALDAAKSFLQTLELDLNEVIGRISKSRGSLIAEETTLTALSQRQSRLDAELASLISQFDANEQACIQILSRQNLREDDVVEQLAEIDGQLQAATANTARLQQEYDIALANRNLLESRVAAEAKERERHVGNLAALRSKASNLRTRLASLSLSETATVAELDAFIRTAEQRISTFEKAIERSRDLIRALDARERRIQHSQKVEQLKLIKQNIQEAEAKLTQIDDSRAGCEAVEKLLKGERQSSVENHIKEYGPLITNIQQRLRSVYGFGGVQLQARGGEVSVEVEWRNKIEKVAPTDFFSDSQKQILMLSIFLAGGLRQNWSGFAPVLLDDPVTHFDDLNAYGFVEMVRGIVSAEPTAWQFIISTCEERLFSLMHKKFARIKGGAIFYEFVGMAEHGPIVEMRM
jgi:exonuclease SbcC